ncbi:MAG: hypothetical protein EOP83_12405 [Verrucomicrobiaceae bacterium]|nr:MAG: hypothetical protein EOP83_12405 [Verrucomicrobiaceae bacterium]
MTLPTPKRTKVANQFYQFSYENRGWLSIHRTHHRDQPNTWRVTVCEYRDWDKSKGHYVRTDEEGYKTIKDAVYWASYLLMTQEEKDARNKIEREESERTLKALTERLERNEVIWRDLEERGVIKPRKIRTPLPKPV